MQVPLKSIAGSQILEKLASKILTRKSNGKIIEKVFLLLCFFLKLEVFFYTSMRICYLISKNRKAKPHENAEFNHTANHADIGSFNLQCKFFGK